MMKATNLMIYCFVGTADSILARMADAGFNSSELVALMAS